MPRKTKYEAGASIRALAEETRRPYGGVHGLLAHAGVTCRSRGGSLRTDSSRR
ncbi:helix-turn-helix domain-containing protein [Streptomyces sp. NPDC127039]|uniref:helix-turn-helix domain-containing protein n=1 Tax=Streptomyces sp. NPDC127039 TaxID=3347115 RepID=UPI0036569EBF